MPAPFGTLRSKNDRAIVAYLLANLPENSQVFAANSSGYLNVAESPVCIVRSHRGITEGNIFSGTFRFQVEIGVHARAANQPNQDNPDLQRFNLDQYFGTICDLLSTTASQDQQSYDATASAITAAGRALAQSHDPLVANQNADMANYTLQEWLSPSLDGGNPRDEGGGPDIMVWKEIVTFEAICNPFNVS